MVAQHGRQIHIIDIQAEADAYPEGAAMARRTSSAASAA